MEEEDLNIKQKCKSFKRFILSTIVVWAILLVLTLIITLCKH